MIYILTVFPFDCYGLVFIFNCFATNNPTEKSSTYKLIH
ncbi:hypothetical protein LEP1GSC036_3080 [Leptospira weilii str. 2006001853]|uniref:Uncharacterized protein n=2 Tax=Leptospira weilii TaxID=28184 RepID=A0A828Z0N4_9LEPT|nr:hypothetical protein LEP1GSC036_3080 [Leptospira weilii str. 2006001853]EMN43458.1 hypothetical protein LEP1GSC086_0518 [Leptospira weilii str. LNT 1234]EMN91001.1 hypothetical protein LEP1GSC108_4251 [Leptospira weilii str. UI 13098]